MTNIPYLTRPATYRMEGRDDHGLNAIFWCMNYVEDAQRLARTFRQRLDGLSNHNTAKARHYRERALFYENQAELWVASARKVSAKGLKLVYEQRRLQRQLERDARTLVCSPESQQAGVTS